jgi:hypothetical protein
MHTIEELDEIVAWKIPALTGRDAITNFAVLERLSLDGPKTVWDANKDLGRTRLQYPTILHAVNRLRKWRYLTKTGTVKMKKKKGRTSKFGVTWRGFFAAMVSGNVCSHILEAVRNNPQLTLPVPRDVFFGLVGTLWDGQQIEEIAQIIFESVIYSIPSDIESTEDQVLIGYLLPALVAALPELEKYPPKNPQELVKYPKVIRFFEMQIDHEIGKFEGMLLSLKAGKDWLDSFKAKERA